MNKEGYINEAEKNILHTYNRFSLVLDHGEGVYLYDTDGKEYLDFAAGKIGRASCRERVYVLV